MLQPAEYGPSLKCKSSHTLNLIPGQEMPEVLVW